MNYHIDIDGQKIPLRIIEERRRSTRVALGSTHVILRIPKVPFFGANIQKHVDWAKNWLQQLKAVKPHVLDKYLPKKAYRNGDLFIIGKHQFYLNIQHAARKSGSIQYKDDHLYLVIPDMPGYDEQKLIRSLLIKFAQNHFLPIIIDRVNYYNRRYFKKPIQQVRLKYNKSNWGSCSTNKALNFSVRLFFAPDDVIDYVVIHELAHLIEMNHGDRFWKIVSDIMPDYKEKEHILKVNNGIYDF
ncbi:MAG: M48 family metallopeptidase [Chitinophagales bacterium]|nr:M48 family metallopeptidase [Chitinophagales bacterium]